jgi:hypothetical protein
VARSPEAEFGDRRSRVRVGARCDGDPRRLLHGSDLRGGQPPGPTGPGHVASRARRHQACSSPHPPRDRVMVEVAVPVSTQRQRWSSPIRARYRPRCDGGLR